MKQMGKEIFEVNDGKVTVNTDKELIHPAMGELLTYHI